MKIIQNINLFLNRAKHIDLSLNFQFRQCSNLTLLMKSVLSADLAGSLYYTPCHLIKLGHKALTTKYELVSEPNFFFFFSNKCFSFVLSFLLFSIPSFMVQGHLPICCHLYYYYYYNYTLLKVSLLEIFFVNSLKLSVVV